MKAKSMRVAHGTYLLSCRFEKPLPALLKQYDMFISLTRVASLSMNSTTFSNSNSRGAVRSFASKFSLLFVKRTSKRWTVFIQLLFFINLN